MSPELVVANSIISAIYSAALPILSEHEEPAIKTPQPEQVIRCAVVGLGHWGPNIVRALDDLPGAKVTAVYEKNGSRRAEIADRFPSIRLAGDFISEGSHELYDAVAIATPTITHYELAKHALNSGLHVLVEKPLTSNPEQARELTELAAMRGKLLMVGHTFLYNGGITAAKKLIDERSLGEVLYVRSIRSNLGPIRADVNALWDLATHDIAISNYIFDADPIEVSCRGFCFLGTKMEDVVQGCLTYPGGRAATFLVSWLDPQKVRQITIVGDRKMIVFDDMNPSRPLRIFDKGVKKDDKPSYIDSIDSFRLSIFEGEVFEPSVSTGQPLLTECTEFIEAIRAGRTTYSDGDFGSRVVAALFALDRSMKESGASVAVDYSGTPSSK